jgi:rRNA maturation RNase YbeY
LLARSGAAAGEVHLILTDRAELRRLNRRFLGRDGETDVIAFDYLEGLPEHAGRIWGDVYVNGDAAREQARERRIPVREELARLFLHGCLHLLGYRDGTPVERARMEVVQESLLADLLRAPRGRSAARPGAAGAGRRRR